MGTRFVMALTMVAMAVASCSSGGGSSSADQTPLLDERPEWEALFVESGTTGTFAVRELGSSTIHLVDQERASTPYLPASTFKILNSLIILETGTVDSVDTIVAWDGVDRELDVWNQEHSLRTGIAVSAVWLYQKHARTVGAARMAELVEASEYGNASIGGGLDQFWLSGDLRITALEQLDVLERLMLDDLPFAPEHQAAVREILVREEGDGWRWLHKTGTALAAEPTLGWLVGATINDDRTWVFALNLDLERIDEDGLVSQIDPHLRISLARRMLADIGALPPP